MITPRTLLLHKKKRTARCVRCQALRNGSRHARVTRAGIAITRVGGILPGEIADNGVPPGLEEAA